ncbi:hypothetical protein BKA64DRAFT_629769 [Cadophora sp. MPI-SDFR-AT-0126]|nr:hypothetical protein BKA64DRAFT_629769 [Leotiomycetes sp. MPI-SDFR-AT-0126]
MQSRLYFSRLGRASLQHARFPLASIGDLLPTRSPTTTNARNLHNERDTVHSIVEGEGSPRSDIPKIPASRRNKGNLLGNDDQPSRVGSQQHKDLSTRGAVCIARPCGPIRMLHNVQSSSASGNFAVHRPSMWCKDQGRPNILTPPIALAQYLDLEEAVEKQTYWRDIRDVLPANSLPTILLHHLHITSISKDDWEEHDHTLRASALTYLRVRGFDMADVEHWAWILTGNASGSPFGQTSDQIVERLALLSSDHPTFLLLEALRKDVQYVESLRKLIQHVWNHFERKFSQVRDSPESEDVASNLNQIHDNEFGVIVSRLLYQARRIWPAAMLSVVNMVPPYIQSLRHRSSLHGPGLNWRIFARSCDIINNVMRLLALPTTIEPLKSTLHSWSAQKVLLDLAGQCDPPLILDHGSYRAVIQVLTASQKINRESKAAILRLRSWPPWRTEQDGMDAQRSPDEDLSRALLAAIRAKEAGFRETSHDQRMRILGGQELDGTPTIHTRKLVKWRPHAPSKRSEKVVEQLDTASMLIRPSIENSHVWAARVEATRDVREAWRAFVAFVDKGGKPSQTLYLAMFEKLNFEQARQGRKIGYEAAPGNGKEVLAVPDDNMSEFYKSHSQPPRLSALYNQMISNGIKPSGQCLIFLVRHARTSTTGINYLRDSGLNPLVLRYWTGSKDTSTSPSHRPPPDILNSVSNRVLGAFVHLICRFAPRAVLTTSDKAVKYKLKPVQPKESVPGAWAIQELEKTPYHRLRDPLRQAARLLKNEKVKYRPAWYSLLKALGRRNILLRVSLIGDPEHDALAWRFTVAVLRNFHVCGLELDPYGLLLVCNVFFKYAEATHEVSPLEHETHLSRGAQLLKDEFAQMSRSEALPFCKPTLLHPMRWATLHVYVRCMGIIGDCDEVLSVLEWMVQHRGELEESNGQDRNGQKMLTRTLVAARISCYGTEYEGKAMELVKQVDAWKWPDDSDLEQYTGVLDNDPEDIDPGEDNDPHKKR